MSRKTRIFITLAVVVGLAFASIQIGLLASGHIEAARIAAVGVTSLIALLMLGISAMTGWTASIRDEHFKARERDLGYLQRRLEQELATVQAIRGAWLHDPVMPWRSSQSPYPDSGTEVVKAQKDILADPGL